MVPAEELRAQLIESVERLLAPVADQRAWIEKNQFPLRELLYDLDLVWPMFRPRLTEAGLINGQVERAMDSLTDYALGLIDPRHEALFQWEAVETASEWAEVRRLAERARSALIARGA